MIAAFEPLGYDACFLLKTLYLQSGQPGRKKCVRLPMEVITEPDVDIEPDLSYQEHPSKVLYCKERSTRARTIKMYKIQWSNHTEEEATWETDDFLRTNYPDFLPKEVGM